MIRGLLVSLIAIACTQDVHIMKIADEESDSEEFLVIDTSTGNEESPSTDSEGLGHEDDISDLTVVFAEYHFRQVACQACLGVSKEFQITAELRIHYPTGGDYTSHLPDIGTCTTNIYETAIGVTPLAASQLAYFNDIPLYPSQQGTWLSTNLYEHQYQRSSQHTITSEHGTASNVFTSLEGFDSIEPYTLLWVDPSYAYDTTISKSGTTFTWSPVVSDSQFEIIVAVYSSNGSTFLGAVSCMENDTGYMTIPGSYIQAYPTNSIVAVHLIRHRQSLVEASDFGGMVQTHMMWEVVGTGHVE
jgi:hypothetical protein